MSSAYNRYLGYMDALKEHDIPYSSQYVFHGNFDFASGYRLGKEIVQSDITAIFANNDMMAYGAIKAIREAGKKVPQDISIVGFDDLIYSEILDVPLTTIHQDMDAIADAIGKYIMKALEEDEYEVTTQVIPSYLIERASVIKRRKHNGKERNHEISHSKIQKWKSSEIELFFMAMLGIIFVLVFAYAPMFGIVLAFKDPNYPSVSIVQTLLNAPFVGFQNFTNFFTDPEFSKVMWNTLGLNILQLLINFPAPIIFAVLLSEIQSKKFRKVIQTITYFPYFLSWVVFGGIILILLENNGVINNVLKALHFIKDPINFGEAKHFWGTIIITSLIKGLGWGAIIYIAAIAGIDPQLYEAARMDGANRWHRIWHITIPSIAPTIVLFFILSLSGILNNGFDHIYTFQNAINLDKSEVLDTFIYKWYCFTTIYLYNCSRII